ATRRRRRYMCVKSTLIGPAQHGENPRSFASTVRFHNSFHLIHAKNRSNPPSRAFLLAGRLQVISFNLLDDRVLTLISDGEEDRISQLQGRRRQDVPDRESGGLSGEVRSARSAVRF